MATTPNGFFVDKSGQPTKVGASVSPTGQVTFVSYDANGNQVTASTGSSTTIATDPIWTAVGQLAIGAGAASANVLNIGSPLTFLQVNAGGTGYTFTTISGGGNALTSNPLSQFAATTSAQLAGVLTDETGTGSAVFATSPTLVTPALGTPSSGNLASCTGLPIASGVSGLATGAATFLATPSSANFAALMTDETGTGANVFATSPTLVTPLLGTPTSGTLTSCTGLPLTTGVTGILPLANGGSGTATPAIVAGTNITVSGTWPNQTINSTASGSGTVTSVGATSAGTYAAALTVAGSPVTGSGSITFTPNLFTSSIPGVVPASGGGTTTFLRADGTFATPSGGGNVSTSGTPTAGQVGVWVTSTTISGVTATGTGSPVLATSPTLTTPTLSGIYTTNGANVTTANAMGALAIDVTKGLNTKSIAADSTFTFSGTPATGDTWFQMYVTNTDTNPHTLTFPSSFSLVMQGARTTCVIPASGQLLLTWRYDTSAVYHIFGDAGYANNFAATVAPTTSNDVTQGYGPGSQWGNITAGTLYYNKTNATGAATWAGPFSTSGTGTVTNTGGALTANSIVLGAGTNDTKVIAGFTTDGTSQLNLGVAGTSVGRLSLFNATSGSVSFQPPTGALGSIIVTPPNANSTLPIFGQQVTFTGPTAARSYALPDVATNIGYLESPINSQSAAYTLVLADSAKTIYHPTTDTTARTWTIPANSSVAYPIGTIITFDNDAGAGALTIAITTDTLVLVGAAGTTGSRTLASGGRASALKVTATRWRISGSAELT